MSDGGNDREREAMYQEEEKLRKQSEREEERKRERDRKEWEKNNGDKKVLKDLDWFLNRSQVRVSLLCCHLSIPNVILGLLVYYHGSAQAGIGSKRRSNDPTAQTSNGWQDA